MAKPAPTLFFKRNKFELKVVSSLRKITDNSAFSTHFLMNWLKGTIFAKKARSKRLEFDLSQSTLSLKSGVSLGTLKNFESSGKISLKSLIKIAIVLESTEDFLKLFFHKESLPISLCQFIKKPQKKRGRKRVFLL